MHILNELTRRETSDNEAVFLKRRTRKQKYSEFTEHIDDEENIS